MEANKHVREQPMTSIQVAILRLSSAVFLICGTSIVASGQSPTPTAATAAAIATPSAEEMSSMIQSSDTANQVESSATPPFHLKARFETFDYLGKPDGNGTVEIFWDGSSRFRHVVTYRDHTRTEVHTEKGTFVADDGFLSSLSQNQLIMGFFYPLPGPRGMEHSDLAYKSLQLPGISMDCVIVTPRFAAEVPVNFQEIQRVYCLNKDSHVLRLAQLPQNMTLVYNDVTIFHGKSVPRVLKLTQGSITRGQMHIEDVSDWRPADDATFHAPEGSEEITSTGRGRWSGGVTAGPARKKLSAPIHPPQGVRFLTKGSVVLQALISRTGDISDLDVVSSPGPSFTDAAMDSVRKWKYEPYLLNGKPVEVETTITLNFNLGG
jgi:TonB family protein